MINGLETSRVPLDSAVFLHLQGRPGTELTCLEGCLWVTRDGSPKDIELAAGERHAVDDRAHFIVCGFGPSVVQIVHRPPRAALLAFGLALQRALAALRRAATRRAVAAA